MPALLTLITQHLDLCLHLTLTMVVPEPVETMMPPVMIHRMVSHLRQLRTDRGQGQVDQGPCSVQVAVLRPVSQCVQAHLSECMVLVWEDVLIDVLTQCNNDHFFCLI